jgi:hypothetical protein
VWTNRMAGQRMTAQMSSEAMKVAIRVLIGIR